MTTKQNVLIGMCHVCGEVNGYMLEKDGTAISEMAFTREMEQHCCVCCGETDVVYTIKKRCRVNGNGKPFNVDMHKRVPDEPRPSKRTLEIMMARFNAMARAMA